VRRPSYRHAVALLAEVDCDQGTVETRAYTISVCIVADLFGVTPEKLAAAVLREQDRQALK